MGWNDSIKSSARQPDKIGHPDNYLNLRKKLPDEVVYKKIGEREKPMFTRRFVQDYKIQTKIGNTNSSFVIPAMHMTQTDGF